MPLSSKFLTESTGQKTVKIGQYLAKTWTKDNSLLFWSIVCLLTYLFRSRLEGDGWLTVDAKHKLYLWPGQSACDTEIVLVFKSK